MKHKKRWSGYYSWRNTASRILYKILPPYKWYLHWKLRRAFKDMEFQASLYTILPHDFPGKLSRFPANEIPHLPFWSDRKTGTMDTISWSENEEAHIRLAHRRDNGNSTD